MDSPIKKLSFDEIKSGRPGIEELSRSPRMPVILLLENIRSLYNVGSVFRTADGALVEKIYLCGYTGYPPRKEIDKTALGSTLSVPWEYCPDPLEAAESLRKRGYQIVCLEHTDKSFPYDEASYRFPLCLILGNEVEGVSRELVSRSDLAVEIPMYGIKQSLNVSVACGIMTYHLVGIFRKMNRK